MSAENQEQTHHGMTPLHDQATLESFLNKNNPVHPMIVVRYGASWCAPCKRINTEKLLAIHPDIKMYYCDIDIDDGTYMLGYCGLHQIPGFICIKNGVPSKALQCSNTDQVEAWIKKQFDL